MSYQILKQWDEVQSQDILDGDLNVVGSTDITTTKTEVQFDFLPDPVVISHFMPKDQDAIIQGIENREVSEQRRLSGS